jgi:hypothetical protein
VAVALMGRVLPGQGVLKDLEKVMAAVVDVDLVEPHMRDGLLPVVLAGANVVVDDVAAVDPSSRPVHPCLRRHHHARRMARCPLQSWTAILKANAGWPRTLTAHNVDCFCNIRRRCV